MAAELSSDIKHAKEGEIIPVTGRMADFGV